MNMYAPEGEKVPKAVDLFPSLEIDQRCACQL